MFRESYPIFLLQRGGQLVLGSFGPAGNESRDGGHGIRPVLRNFFYPPLATVSDKFRVPIVG
jgi:hypothetical protein